MLNDNNGLLKKVLLKCASVPSLALGKVAAWIPSQFCIMRLHLDFAVILLPGDDSGDEKNDEN